MIQLRRILSSQLAQNIVSNYLTVVWMGGLSLMLIPFYLRYLGAEQWGVVAICMVLQSLWGLLDAGLSQLMPRDIARAGGGRDVQAKVYRVYVRAYWLLGLAGFLVGQLAISWLITHWFNRGEGLSGNADMALRLVLVQFLFQFGNNANVGYWNGRELQKLANVRLCFFGTLKHLGALALMVWWRADALAYLLPFALVAMLEWWLNSRVVRGTLGSERHEPVSIDDLKKLGREAGVMVLGVLIGMLVSQIDRIVLSRSVDVASFGRYVIVANLGLAFMQLQYPLMRAYFPRIVREDGRGASASVRRLGAALFVLCILPSAVVALLAPWILQMWLGDAQMTEVGAAPLRLILMAVALNAVYHLIYQRIVAKGNGRPIVMINIACLLVVMPITVFAVDRLGITGGGLAWLVTSLVQLGLGAWWWFKIAGRDQQQGEKNHG